MGDTVFEDIHASYQAVDLRKCKSAAQAKSTKRCKLARLLSEHRDWESLVVSTPEYELAASNNLDSDPALRA